MERVDLLGFLIVTLNCNVTFVGKIWLIFMILLRMGVIILAGSPIYQDEQERFVCNTLQPGCSNVCYDIFSPVSHLRFWLIQSVSTLLPSAVFSVYVLHRGAVLAAHGSCGPDSSPGAHDLTAGNRRCSQPCRGRSHLLMPDFSSGYIVHLFLRTLMEAAFGTLQYLLFGFLVPKRFSCTHAPCTSVVDCYISRPTEKSIMMLFIWAVSALSLLLSFADLICSMKRKMSGRPGPRCVPKSVPSRKMGARGQWEAEEVPTHPELWMGGEEPESPSGKSAVSGRMELADEEDSEVMSSVSNKLTVTRKELMDRPQRETTHGPRSEGSSRPQEHPPAPQSQLTQLSRSSHLQPCDWLASSGSAAYLRTRKSEWV
ncbi:PREDICTED: gap junction delta-4 protein [Condylura cristata]|uniref:gap junction delta-4 protein n=1 Tax=Condylura cristata TaxID=143302 RepID=UPI0003345553|nr:PREDICTED: gap junction delta-4 protein [Condylura cristata]